MRLCFSNGQDLMLLNSLAGMNGLHERLQEFEFFHFDDDEEGAHHHPEHVSAAGYLIPESMSLIIEVDSDWVEEIRAES